MSHSTTASSHARLWLDGELVTASTDCSLAAFLLQHRPGGWSRSVGGEVRAPLCGMGICFECRVHVDGQSRLACMTPCRDGMTVQTEGRPARQPEDVP